MVCYLIFRNLVKSLLGKYNVNDEEAKEILEDIEKETGHNKELIKAIIDFEGEGLIKRLRRRKKVVGKEVAKAYT